MPSLPVGFYRDPVSGSVRRWDGSSWRELPPLVTPPAYALPIPQPPARSGAAKPSWRHRDGAHR
jgi:hypothetical protein